MEKDPVLEKYSNEGFGKNAFGWYFNPWIDEYDETYDPHNDPEYNKELNNKNNNINKNVEEKDNPGKKDEPNIDYDTDKNSGKKDKPYKEDKTAGKNNEKVETEEKRKIKSIGISPIKSKIMYIFDSIENDVKNCKDSDEVTFNYRDEQLKNVAEIVKRITKMDDIDSISGALDPNVLKWLITNSKVFDIQINDYIDMLKGKDTTFNMTYDLRNIYDSTLDYNQIKNLNQISKVAKQLNKDKVIILRDNLRDRFIGNIKKRQEQKEQRKIGKNSTKKRKIKGVNSKKRFFTKKPKMISKINVLSSNALNKVKEKWHNSREFFANKLKIDPTAIKEQDSNNVEEKKDNQEIKINSNHVNFVLYDPTYYDEK